MIKDAHDKGYETTLNLMAISVIQDKDLFEAVEALSKTPVDIIYVVDSFGALYPEQVRDLTKNFVNILAGTNKNVGIHAHNNQQLAYANTIDALIYGANRLDATINGLGRGAGNCPLELLLGFLKNPRYDLRPVLDTIEKVFVPLRDNIKWGYNINYMISGQLNQHPREAIKASEGATPNKFLEFFDKMIEEES
jgi:4-hydroxy 2-oxovalerate aldolase